MLKAIASRRFLMVLICAMVILGVLGISISYSQLSKVSELDVLESIETSVQMVGNNINAKMKSMETLVQSLIYDSIMQASIQRSDADETLENQIAEIRPMRELIGRTEENQYVRHVRVFLNDKKILTREGVNFFKLTDVLETEEYRTMSSRSQSHMWLGEHPVQTVYYDDISVTYAYMYRASFSTDSSNWAVLFADFSPDMFLDIMNCLDMPEGEATIVLVDQNGQPMVGQGDCELLSHILEDHKTSPYGYLSSDNAYVYASCDLASAGWAVVVYLPRSSLLSSQRTLRKMLTLLLCGLTILVVALCVILSMGMYSRYLNHYVMELHQNLTSENLNRHMMSHHILFNLDKNINKLLETNKYLSEEKIRAELREREVTLQALQAQINPHFLYNTLDSINWMAIRVHADEVSEAITTLADYFRLSLSKGQSVVTLEEDVEIVRKYLTLMEKRYNDPFEVRWNLSPESLQCSVPKLTLQPLVENALQHGIFMRRERTGGIVEIMTALEDDRLILSVHDNGPGLPSDMHISSGYGLENVRKRLDLYFNDQYEITLKNGEQGGAVVTVKVQESP